MEAGGCYVLQVTGGQCSQPGPDGIREEATGAGSSQRSRAEEQEAMAASGSKGNACGKRGREKGKHLHSRSGLLLEWVSQKNCQLYVFEDIANVTRQDHEKPHLVLKVALT